MLNSFVHLMFEISFLSTGLLLTVLNHLISPEQKVDHFLKVLMLIKIKIRVRKFVIHQGQGKEKNWAANENSKKPQMAVKIEVFYNQLNN